jgi:hypothetical protein
MYPTRKRSALAAAVTTMAIAGPVAGASAATPVLPAALPATGLPAFTFPPLSFTAPSVHIATVIGPTIIGSIVFEGPGAAGQVAAGAPQAISLLSTQGGGTAALGGQ